MLANLSAQCKLRRQATEMKARRPAESGAMAEGMATIDVNHLLNSGVVMSLIQLLLALSL